MPNLPMHIYLADQVAEQLDRGYVFDHMGAYYLGSTAPDIRAMTRWPREQTHFAPFSAAIRITCFIPMLAGLFSV